MPDAVNPFPTLRLNPTGTAAKEDSGDLLFVGDFYLGPGVPPRGIRTIHEKLASRIRNASFSVANFESAIERHGRPQPKDGPHIASGKAALPLLRAVGFDAVLLANNHIMDFGVDAMLATVREIQACGLAFGGIDAPPDYPAAPVTTILPGGQRVSIFSFCEREFGTNALGPPGACWLGPEAEPQISEAKRRGDVVIVNSHGGNELVPLPSLQRRAQLRRLVEAGADLVIGHHTHVPQGWEQWRHSFIFYSLGDFYFQDPGGALDFKRQWSFMVRATLEADRINRIDVIPFERVGDEVVPLGAVRDADSHMAYLQRLSAAIASDEFPACWQQLAVDLMLEGYLPLFRGLLPHLKPPGASFRAWLKGAVKSSLNSLDYFGSGRFSSFRKPGLALLNTMSCESHRWTVETALSVLSGEAPDLRTPKTRREISELRYFQNMGKWPDAKSPRPDELPQCR
ncbi:MAG: CapA family protein [Bryobacteraceae bacterium]